MFTVNDPAYQGNSDNVYELTYSELFCSPENGENSERVNLWFPSVVAKSDLSGKTLIEEVVEIEYNS